MKIQITKKFGEKLLFDRRQFLFEDGKITAVLGESGVGKTTLLRALAGLEKFEGETDAPNAVSVAFQEPRLLPFYSALKNLTFVGIDEEKAIKWLSWAEIADFTQKTSTLSGGEKQRVSLARALAKDGELLLFDEPFSSVDLARKVRLLTRLKAEISTKKHTTVFVTHDIDEALYIADKILLLKDGETVEFTVTKADRAGYGESPLRQKIYGQLL